jgi:Tfp pilus assembly PilM family ATPase
MKRKDFLKIFPPPQYIEVPYTGVIFTDNSVRMIALDKKNRHPTFAVETALEPGQIKTGEIKNTDAIAQVLAEKRALVPSPFVKFCVPDQISYVFSAKVPIVEGRDATESISFILEENVPLPLADISFDFGIKKIDRTTEGLVAEVAVMATSASTLESYINVLRKADFEPILCITESQAVAQSIIPTSYDKAATIVHLHKQSIGLYIVYDGLVIFSSVLPIQKSESIKDKSELIKTELSRAIEYSSAKTSGIAKEQDLPCYICGEYENAVDLSKELSSISHIVQQTPDAWVNVFSVDDYIPDISFEDSLRFAPAIGLFIDKSD